MKKKSAAIYVVLFGELDGIIDAARGPFASQSEVRRAGKAWAALPAHHMAATMCLARGLSQALFRQTLGEECANIRKALNLKGKKTKTPLPQMEPPSIRFKTSFQTSFRFP